MFEGGNEKLHFEYGTTKWHGAADNGIGELRIARFAIKIPKIIVTKPRG